MAGNPTKKRRTTSGAPSSRVKVPAFDGPDPHIACRSHLLQLPDEILFNITEACFLSSSVFWRPSSGYPPDRKIVLRLRRVCRHFNAIVLSSLSKFSNLTYEYFRAEESPPDHSWWTSRDRRLLLAYQDCNPYSTMHITFTESSLECLHNIAGQPHLALAVNSIILYPQVSDLLDTHDDDFIDCLFEHLLDTGEIDPDEIPDYDIDQVTKTWQTKVLHSSAYSRRLATTLSSLPNLAEISLSFEEAYDGNKLVFLHDLQLEDFVCDPTLHIPGLDRYIYNAFIILKAASQARNLRSQPVRHLDLGLCPPLLRQYNHKRSFLDSVPLLKGITSIHLDSAPYSADCCVRLLKQTRDLRSLRLSNQCWTTRGQDIALLRGLVTCSWPRLACLAISDFNEIDTDLLVGFVSAHRHTLRRIQLVNVTMRFWRLVLDAIKSCPNLKSSVLESKRCPLEGPDTDVDQILQAEFGSHIRPAYHEVIHLSWAVLPNSVWPEYLKTVYAEYQKRGVHQERHADPEEVELDILAVQMFSKGISQLTTEEREELELRAAFMINRIESDDGTEYFFGHSDGSE